MTLALALFFSFYFAAAPVCSRNLVCFGKEHEMLRKQKQQLATRPCTQSLDHGRSEPPSKEQITAGSFVGAKRLRQLPRNVTCRVIFISVPFQFIAIAFDLEDAL